MLALHLDYYLDSFISVLARAFDEVDDIQIDIRKGFRDAFDADGGAVVSGQFWLGIFRETRVKVSKYIRTLFKPTSDLPTVKYL